MKENNTIPIVDCPYGDYMIGDASGKLMNEYARFPCKIKCGVYALLVRGTAHATINVNEYDFKANDILLLEPGSFLLIREFSEDALVYWIVFGSKFLEKHTVNNKMSLSALQLHSPKLSTTENHAKVLCAMYDAVVQAMNAQPTMLDSEKMVHIFNLLQTSYAKYAHEQDEYLVKPLDRKTEIYQEYCQMVLQHYQEWHHVNQYADAMRLTLPHLCSTIKSVGNRTAGDIIVEAILTDAKSQLKITNQQIKEIALNLGFDNVAFFNRFFKSHVGVTPKAYRNS
ncbi:MAG: helix-turn-helix transcriptional regulator [Paludibacteraceae bacterium]|nr:helix-turn-helix transcriptional regulator [Paludibacteraceae bacterium]